jgi:hypothetical protein
MTLATRVYVQGFVPRDDLLAVCRAHVARFAEGDGRDPANHTTVGPRESWKGSNLVTIGNVIGQGLPSMLHITYCPDGPVRTPEQSTEHDDDCADDDTCDGDGRLRRWGPHQPPCVYEIDWDTGYAYTDEWGGCAELHARFIILLGLWLQERRVPWMWANEFTGDLYDGFDGLCATYVSDYDGRERDAFARPKFMVRWIEEDLVPTLNGRDLDRIDALELRADA